MDFQDEAQFETNIDLLVKGIRLQPNHSPSSQLNPTVKPLLASLSFLWFFPEGMLVGLYRYVIAQMKLEGADSRAEKAGLVSIFDSEGPTMIGADAAKIRELRVLISDPAKTAQRLLSNIKYWADESGVFHDMAGFGVGRALLIRDALSLIQYTTETSDSDSDLKAWVFQTARNYLLRIAEQHLRIAVEISKGLLTMAFARTAADDLVHAHLLLRMGEAGQSADLFEAYRGSDLFDQLDLTKMERFNFALDWAKATKDAGRARQMHTDLVQSYASMLQLLRELQSTSDEEKRTLARAEADLLNNWATQVAQFGNDSEWTEAQKSFSQIYDIYQSLGDNDRLIGARANWVAQSLDRFDREQLKASEKHLRSLLSSLEKLDSVVDKSRASENVFFFLYQKARLLKRLNTEDPAKAAEYYKRAASAANEARLPQRSAIARCWELRLQQRAGEMSEEQYLSGLLQCADSLRAYSTDAWAARSLGNLLLNVARILKNRGAIADAWDTLLEVWDLEAPGLVWSQSNAKPTRMREILKAMNGLNADDNLRNSFLKKNAALIKQLTGVPEYENLDWSVVADWLNR